MIPIFKFPLRVAACALPFSKNVSDPTSTF
jgi:hypothetical protein